MSATEGLTHAIPVETNPIPIPRGIPSAFEKLITDQPPILQSLIAQLPTQSVLALYHTSSYLNNFLKSSPTSWRYISWRLYQPAATIATPTNNSTGTGPRQSSNYALDQLLLYVINPFSTRLVSLELDNTAVGGSTLFQTVMILRKDTLEHVSVRGCKNVSLKYHVNPWLIMHAMALDMPQQDRAPGYEKLALKSLYTYRCRHHRRRPYLPTSLARKESDSEPTHDLVLTCHKLGIWTDTAWCTTPGSRCFRRRGYVTLRVPQDLRDVWVVYDRLWRSRNWLGPVPDNRSQTSTTPSSRKRKRDCRSWEFDEEAMNGESVTIKGEGKATPTHARKTHKQFVDDIYCDNCSDPILERCEQCSVMMHCSGCRKTLCASCAFDRPYLRNKMASEEERNKNKFWWAPGYAVSPCSMLDQDPIPAGNGGNAVNHVNNSLPVIKFRWCCTEPVFSGGGGITFGNGQSREADRLRAAPLPTGHGWEDPEFSTTTGGSDVFGGRTRPQPQATNSTADDSLDLFAHIGAPLTRMDARGPGGRWPSIDSLFRRDPSFESDQVPQSVPRILCDSCYQSDQWKIKCKACSVALCLKHDVRDRLKVRLCGYKDLTIEKAEFRSRQRALKLITMLMMRRRKGKMKAIEATPAENDEILSENKIIETTVTTIDHETLSGLETPRPTRTTRFPNVVDPVELSIIRGNLRTPVSEPEASNRPISPSSNSTGPPSRASSPTPSARSTPVTPEPNNNQRSNRSEMEHPVWNGCQSFFCPATRAPGDHRRRCVAVMRQCAECKIYVCEQCTASLEAPCPCKGCRVPTEEGQPEATGETSLRFFCPNCRWSRMDSGKCKRKIAYTKKDLKKKSNNRKNKFRKPLEERRGFQRSSSPTIVDVPRDMTDGLVEFFENLQTTENEVTTNDTVQAEPSSEIQETSGEEIRELEDMGALARDLIRRIQTLRRQFGPTSLAALALPDIRVDDNGSVRHHLQLQQNISSSSVQPRPGTQHGDDAQASSSETGV